MKFSDYLSSLGIYFNEPDDAGGGAEPTPSLEQMTNQKLGMGDDEPTPEPTPADPPPKKDPVEPEPSDGGDDPEDPPSDPASDDDPTPPASGDEGGDEGGDDEFFYDPAKHVEGTPAHTNKFKTKEKAEYAAIHKAERLRDKLAQMKEDGVDRGAILLPGALDNDPEAIERLMNLEQVHQMEDDDLRSFLNEADYTYQRLEEKHQRVKSEKTLRQANDRFEELQVELYDSLKNVMPIEQLQSNLAKFDTLEEGQKYLKAQIDNKVKSELSSERESLEQWIDKVDSGEINLSIKEYDEQKQEKLDSIARKEAKIREDYKDLFDKHSELIDLAGKVNTAKEATPEQKTKNMWSSFDEMQKDVTPQDLALLEDTPEARAEFTAAKNWAIQNRADYNDLQHPSDWLRALKNGWPDFKKRIQADRQKKELKSGDEKPAGSPGGDDPIPKPGDQTALKAGKGTANQNRKTLDKLEQLTNARVGVE